MGLAKPRVGGVTASHPEGDQLPGLVVRASGYKLRGPGFDSRSTMGIFLVGGGSPW